MKSSNNKFSSSTPISSFEVKQSIISIELDRPILVYFAGETITGRVIVATDQPKRDIEELNISIGGFCQASWTEKFRNNSTVSLNPSESHFFEELNLYTNHNGEDSVKCEGGICSFPFSLELPLDIPSSFNSATGQVEYYMTARAKISGCGVNLMSKLQFTVHGILDLNKEPGVSHHFEIERQQNFCGWPPWKDSFVRVRVLLQRKGFVCGEIVPFTVKVHNKSAQKVVQINAELVQKVSYITRYDKIVSNSVLTNEIRDINISPKETRTIVKQFTLRIPPCLPSRLGCGCNVIHVNYYIKTIVKLSGLAWNLIISPEIIVGTIPLRETLSQFMPTKTRRNVKLNDSRRTGQNSTPSELSDIAGMCIFLTFIYVLDDIASKFH